MNIYYMLLILSLTIYSWKLVVSNESRSRSFNIGGIVESNATQEYFKLSTKRTNFDAESIGDLMTLYDETVILQGNAVTSAGQVCQSLITKRIHAMVMAAPSSGVLTTLAVSYISSYNFIPVICTHSRDSAFSDKNIHGLFLRTVPPYSSQVDVWMVLLKHFHYRQVILIHSADTNGHAVYSRFQTLSHTSTKDESIKLSAVIEFQPNKESFVKELNLVRKQLVKVLLLYASKGDAETIFHDAHYLNMTGPGYVWLVTEQALDVRYVPVGTLGLQLKYAHDTGVHITDALRIAALGLRQLHQEDDGFAQQLPPYSCNDDESWKGTGKALFDFIRQQVLYDGETGKVAFDLQGDRLFSEYDLINVQNRTNLPLGINNLQIVGDFSYHNVTDDMKLSINIADIEWPGGGKDKPLGYNLPTHFKIMTLREKPFVYAEPVATPDVCATLGGIVCPVYNYSTNETESMCCSGFCIDLLQKMADKSNFTFDLELSPDGQYGDFYYDVSQGKKKWTGIIGELVNEEHSVDMLVAPLTINPERSSAIEFSKPFKYQGITILVKRVPHVTALVSILQPFRVTLWLILFATVHIITIVMWFLDRLSPFYQEASDDGDDSASLSLAESFWFSWAVILNSGLTEGTPRCLSGRMLGIIWGGFAMIIVASYTANLAAFLVLDSPVTAISGINDARLRNPAENFTFATIRGSAVDMFFQRKTEWSNMYRVMEAHNYQSVEEALQAIRDGTLHAFIWESSRLEFEASRDCNLVTVGELFGRSGYGLGLKKGSPWTEKITIDILDLHERGYIEALDKKWIWKEETDCPENLLDEGYSKRLGLTFLEGIFLMVAGGILSGIFLVIVEVSYDRLKERKQKKKKKKENNAEEVTEKEGNGSKGGAKSGTTEKVKKGDSINHFNTEGPSEGDENGQESCPFLPKAGHDGFSRNSEMGEGENPWVKFVDPGNPCSQLLFQDIEERLKQSPNIPEEWKTRSPLEWFQYYLDILRQDAAGGDSREGSQSKEAVAVMEGFVEFVREAGIKDFSEIYDEGLEEYDDLEVAKVSKDFSLIEGNQSVNCDPHSLDTVEEVSEQVSLEHDGDETNLIQFQPSFTSTLKREFSKQQQLENLPDVLDNCSERGIKSKEVLCGYDFVCVGDSHGQKNIKVEHHMKL